MTFSEIYLASRSPRRQELLTQMQVPYSVVVPDIDESPLCQESPHEYVVRIAQQKAQAGLKLIEGKKSTTCSRIRYCCGDRTKYSWQTQESN
jgi:septum formation protein